MHLKLFADYSRAWQKIASRECKNMEGKMRKLKALSDPKFTLI